MFNVCCAVFLCTWQMLYILCFVSDIHFSIFHVCNWFNRLWVVGGVYWDEVSDLLAVGELYTCKHQRRSCSYCNSSFLLVYSSVEYSCANISVCLVRLHFRLIRYCKLLFLHHC